jgi:hypothetical protein
MWQQFRTLNDNITVTPTATRINDSNIPEQDSHNTLLLQNQSESVAVYFTDADGETQGIKLAPGQLFEYPIEFSASEKIYLKTASGSAVVAFMVW